MFFSGTIYNGAELLHREGAREVYACCTHAVLRYTFLKCLSLSFQLRFKILCHLYTVLVILPLYVLMHDNDLEMLHKRHKYISLYFCLSYKISQHYLIFCASRDCSAYELPLLPCVVRATYFWLQSTCYRETIRRAISWSYHDRHNTCERTQLLSPAHGVVSCQSSGRNHMAGAWWHLCE